ncbi:TolC family protein [Cupriavidus sp. D384]|uniref:TolC family protein n=1 Tax=Cupriavidus sp. D384 TaxID=1538095 RepID=UPI00082E8C60|nr:TolC family protein [Cupriavidus sp. D384]
MNTTDLKLTLCAGLAASLWTSGLCAAEARTSNIPAMTEDSYLPTVASVRAALDTAPDVAAARARRDSASARAGGIRAGTAEFVVRATGQRRHVRDPSDNFAEGQVAIERPLRLWGKSDADAALADATIDQGDIALDDAQHETSKQMLVLWFNVLRARQSSAAMARSAALAGDLVASTGKRVRASDAAPMDLEIVQAEQARAEAALAAARATQGAAEAELRARFPALGLPAVMPSDAPVATLLPAAAGDLLGEGARVRYLDVSHAVRLAIADEAVASRAARRSDLERKPDPTVGAFVTVERGGAERIAGLSISMPLGSAHRRSVALATAADAEAAARRRAAVEQAAGAEFDVLARTVTGLEQAARAQQTALTLDQSAADRAARAYSAGEIGIGQLLVVRRGLAETTLAARAALVNALEAQQKLRLELHEQSRFEAP